MHYIGIDLGTSGVKVVVCDQNGVVIDSESAPLTVSSPSPTWSEQSPSDWWLAIDKVLLLLGDRGSLKEAKAIGLAGQMHGAVFLDSHGEVIRPAILWNDGRCAKECEEMMLEFPESTSLTGNLIMPGFTAPKVRWLAKHEAANFNKISKVLLPKDYIRYLLTGNFVSDMSDAAGTCWLDTKKRDWSDTLLQLCGLNRSHMPALVEGTESSGTLKESLSKRWNVPSITVVGGAGDNAAGAIGSGVTDSGQAMLSLGTSGVIFAVTDDFVYSPELALHSFCHALPNKWHAMSVHLSAASCLQWFANIAANGDVAPLLNELNSSSNLPSKSTCFFIPYLSGERTPHNDPSLTGRFCNLTHNTSRSDMTYAVLEGVAFAFKDGLNIMQDAGVNLHSISVIGGGARSQYWRQLISDVLGLKIAYRQGGEVGPALGAAKLAQINIENTKELAELCPAPPINEVHRPDENRHQLLMERYKTFKQLASQPQSN
ncbi:xylulokinase [Alteromonas sp. HB246098]